MQHDTCAIALADAIGPFVVTYSLNLADDYHSWLCAAASTMTKNTMTIILLRGEGSWGLVGGVEITLALVFMQTKRRGRNGLIPSLS